MCRPSAAITIGAMIHPVWPLFDLRVITPRLELRYIDDELAVALADLAAQGVHDPAYMPFGIPWTDTPPPEQQRQTMQWYWRCRANLTAEDWNLELAVLADGDVVGATGLMAKHFPTLRTFETGSWLGRRFQGIGLGKELRAAALHLGFAGLGATEATTRAYTDNAASLGVTASLGYTRLGTVRQLRRTDAAELIMFRMPRADWERVRRDDITIHGVDRCLELLGLG